MNNLDHATQTQLDSIQSKLGMSLNDMADIVKRTKLTKHESIRSMLQREYGLGYYDAKAVVAAMFEPAPEKAG
jgi:hypothetical protein